MGHIEAIRAVRPIDSVRVVGRDPAKVDALIRNFGNVWRGGAEVSGESGFDSSSRLGATSSAGGEPSVSAAGHVSHAGVAGDGLVVEAAGPEAVAGADIVACCTTARGPLFDGKLLRDDAVVVAVGSHEPDAREVDAETVRRCGALVESRVSALREAGDLIQAGVAAGELYTFSELVRGVTPARPRLIKTVGMGWEDLVIAAAVVESLS
ncbi:hypothetical protein JIG36_08890 [Actinoplanes sp. LDG1-06]|uniref:Ornithine cyclodeaminase n=1 Tax=Paractinoplanes ovalisporus TaxID=2810368 RepID=A0ABS2A749_9ACTN|nr:hypothetical protein [Actinoplanes ovalisporus]